MAGMNWDWIAGAVIGAVLVLLAMRLRGGGSDRTDLSGAPPGAARPAPPTGSAPTSAVSSGFAASAILKPLPEPDRQAIAAALAGGNKIMAIKLFREATGMGLKESKDAIEAIEGQSRR